MAQSDPKTGTDEAALIEELAAGATYSRAATVAGCSERTAKRRMADAGFRARVQQARSASLEHATGLLAEGATEAAKALRDLLDSDSDSIRLAAAHALLDCHLRVLAATEFDRRLAALESGANGGPPQWQPA